CHRTSQIQQLLSVLILITFPTLDHKKKIFFIVHDKEEVGALRNFNI
uniref:Uncharacterized protein n=1 Tax=Loxodonta africana TaxID=9785 RepID=G3TUH0_LOXAF